VDENLSEISYQAAALLDELMNQGAEKVVRKPVIVPPKGVVMRRSTDSLAVTHPGLQRALAFVGVEFSKNIGIEDVARAAGISQRALQYVFKEELARTPAQHLAKSRLEHARHWLVSSELPVGAVAQKCGFGTLRHFHRSFVKAYGSSPQAFRQGISS
jgi:LacI family transcriptional regulator